MQKLQDELEAIKQSSLEKDKRVEELTDYIGKAAADREQIIHTYTSYGQQVSIKGFLFYSNRHTNKTSTSYLLADSSNRKVDIGIE